MTDLAIIIGRETSEHVRIEVRGRAHAGADDYWDGNWLVTPLHVVVSGFEGDVPAACLRADELAAFRVQVAQMRDTLRGEASLESMEEWVHLKMTIDRTGHITVSGSVRERPGTGNTLAFRIDMLDQTDLDPLLAHLDAALVAFPLFGPPR